jgi:hypothetical protein
MAISDLSIAELVQGTRTIGEYELLKEKLERLDFVSCGLVESLRTLVSVETMNGVTNQNDLEKYHCALAKETINVTMGFFKTIVISYCLLFYFLIDSLDPKGGFGAANAFLCIIQRNKEKLDMLIECYFPKKAETDKDIPYEFAMLLANLAFPITIRDFEKSAFFHEACRASVPRTLSKMTSLYISSLNSSGKMDDYEKKAVLKGNEAFLMLWLRRNNPMKSTNVEIAFDAALFGVINCGFTCGKFHRNDLVDIYNIGLLGQTKTDFQYFTNDKKWRRFLETERKVNNSFFFRHSFMFKTN